MISSLGMPAPLSPVLLLGLAARPLPLEPLQPVLAAAMGAVRAKYPNMFERLSDFDNTTFLIDPTDLPFGFLLIADTGAPELTAIREDDIASQDIAATIRGPLMVLIEMLEGKTDGDAQFFSRSLVVEGDTEAVVALRNAVDGSGIDLVQVFKEKMGAFAGPVANISTIVKRLYDTATHDLDCLRRAAAAPTEHRNDVLAAKIRRLEATLEKQVRGSRSRKSSS